MSGSEEGKMEKSEAKSGVNFADAEGHLKRIRQLIFSKTEPKLKDALQKELNREPTEQELLNGFEKLLDVMAKDGSLSRITEQYMEDMQALRSDSNPKENKESNSISSPKIS